MEPVTHLAHHLDLMMLLDRGIDVANEGTPIADLPTGDPQTQLGGRLLIKYVRGNEAEKYSVTSGVSRFPGIHYLTPTPVACADLRHALALPPLKRPKWVLLLRPAGLTAVRGPRRVQGGHGVEYILEDGFSSTDFADPNWVLPYS